MVEVLVVSENLEEVANVISSIEAMPEIESVELVSPTILPENFEGIIFCHFQLVELEKLNPNASVFKMTDVD